MFYILYAILLLLKLWLLSLCNAWKKPNFIVNTIIMLVDKYVY